MDVVNRGYGGYNTIRALQILPHIIPPPPTTPKAPRIRLFSVFLGANDARLHDEQNAASEPNQHVDEDEYRANILKILDFAPLLAHKPRFVLVTPPPIDERLCLATDRQKGMSWKRREAQVTARYAQVVRDVGKERGVPVVDLWTALINRVGGWDGKGPIPGSDALPKNELLMSYLRDGLHFSGEAYKVFFDEWISTVTKNYPDLDPEKLPKVFPAWDDPQAWSAFERSS